MLSELDKRCVIFGEKCQDFKHKAFQAILPKYPISFPKPFFSHCWATYFHKYFYTMMPSSFYSVTTGYWPSTCKCWLAFTRTCRLTLMFQVELKSTWRTITKSLWALANGCCFQGWVFDPAPSSHPLQLSGLSGLQGPSRWSLSS